MNCYICENWVDSGVGVKKKEIIFDTRVENNYITEYRHYCYECHFKLKEINE